MKPRELMRSCVIASIMALAAAIPAGDFWWMGKDNAFGGAGGQNGGGQTGHNGGQNEYNDNNQVQQNLPQVDQFVGSGSQQAQVNDYPQQQIGTGSASSSSSLGLPVTQGLPATQGLITASSSSPGSCPAISIIPPVEECAGRSSNCWSVGQADVDCVDNALCCFDGCANVCQGGGVIKGNPTPATNARGQVVIHDQIVPQNVLAANQPQNVPQVQTIPEASEVLLNVQTLPQTIQEPAIVGSPISKPAQKQKPKRRGYGGGSSSAIPSERKPVISEQNLPLSNGGGNGQPIVFPLDSVETKGGSISPVQPPNPVRKPQPAPVRKPQPAPVRNPQPAPVRKPQPAPVRKPQPAPVRKPQPAPVRKPQPAPVRKPQPAPVRKPQPAPAKKPQRNPSPSNNFQQSQGASRPVVPAAQKPYVTCPAAMKCVERPFCDFNGVMTDQPLNNLTPQLEMLRVPLIPCVNRQRDNNVDVCCRDPNYNDPWPDMNGNNGQGQNGNNGQNANNGLNGNNANQGFQNQAVIQNNQRQNQNSVGHNNKSQNKNKKKNNRKSYGG